MALDGSSQRGAWYLDAAPATISIWLTRLRWTRAAVDAGVLAAAVLLPAVDFPLHGLAPFVAASLVANGDLAWRLSRTLSLPRWMSAVAIAIDVVLLTGLLELSGGPSNPFSVIYLALIALAGAQFGLAAGVPVAAWAALCYGVLIYWHLGELVPAHHRLIDFPTHLFTMWLAIAVVAELVGHFVRDASAAIARQQAEIDRMQRTAVRAERLMSLTTLAAGAAHELSTPLATIAITSHELNRALAESPLGAAVAADARLIREQVDRCHAILDQMSGRAGGSAADLAEPTDIHSLFADLRQRLPPEQAERVQVRVAPALTDVLVPRAGLIQVMLSLVKNAVDATDASSPIVVEGAEHDRLLRLSVSDAGRGMSTEVLERAGEPFYTTKEPGAGSGLGLFLARMFAERWGGTLTLQSSGGTTAILELPLSHGRPGEA